MKAWPLSVRGRYINPGHDGWCVKYDGVLLPWTASTTREECRQVITDRPDIFDRAQVEMWKRYATIVKIKFEIKECV